jgi:hypothetical protein
MLEPDAIAASLISSFKAAEYGAQPFRHWLPKAMLPQDVLQAIDALPVEPPRIADTFGKRETHNSTRTFFGAEARAENEVCDALAHALQGAEAVGALERLTGAPIREGYLRIEYCLDTDGFWLEPHTDIGAKLFTMLIYLSREPGSEAWGTDILDSDKRLVAVTPYHRNDGLIFVPAADTWHGFHKRPINGVRRSLIVNYVKPEWRSRHELAFPDRLAGH